MSKYANTAAGVRRHKEKHPERYCKVCLWLERHLNGNYSPCPRHSKPECEACGERACSCHGKKDRNLELFG